MKRKYGKTTKTIAFMSETYALKAKRALESSGIWSYPVTLTEPTKRGCSHGLVINADEENTALSVLMTAAVGKYDVIR